MAEQINDITALVLAYRSALSELVAQVGSVSTLLQQLGNQVNESALVMKASIDLEFDTSAAVEGQLRKIAEDIANQPIKLPKVEDLGIKEIKTDAELLCEGLQEVSAGVDKMAARMNKGSKEWTSFSAGLISSFGITQVLKDRTSGYIGFVGESLGSLSALVDSNGGEWVKWSSTVINSIAKAADKGGLGYLEALSTTLGSLGDMVGSKGGEWMKWSSTVVESLAVMLDEKNDLEGYFDFICGTMTSLGGMVGGNAEEWLNWGANLASAVGMAITQIMALIPVKNAEANANVTNAATGAASAVSSIPFVGPALAVAAVASVLATLASIPKMADGGIAYGPTMALFGEYAGAANNPEIVAPLNKLRTLIQPSEGSASGRVEFKIQGRELVGILQKMNHINSRVNG